MGMDTIGKIKGYIRHEEIFNFIKQKYDKNAKDCVTLNVNRPLNKCNWEYTINEHSEDNENWYDISGFIYFDNNGEQRMLFYNYSNINCLENIDYYAEWHLEDMVRSETTHISLGYHGNSVNIIKEIIAHFGGGWIDENDCDDIPYYPVEVNKDGSIKPVVYVTMEDIYDKFGGIVVITQ